MIINVIEFKIYMCYNDNCRNILNEIGIDLTKVTKIKILEVADYHG